MPPENVLDFGTRDSLPGEFIHMGTDIPMTGLRNWGLLSGSVADMSFALNDFQAAAEKALYEIASFNRTYTMKIEAGSLSRGLLTILFGRKMRVRKRIRKAQESRRKQQAKQARADYRKSQRA